VPSILIKDFASGEITEILVNKGEVGEIECGLNTNYVSNELRFSFNSPFVYNQSYVYRHNIKKTSLLKEFKLRGPQIVRNEFDC